MTTALAETFGDDSPAARARAAWCHAPRLLRVAKRILQDPDLAHDAVQEALCTLAAAPHAPENVLAWLLRAVVHRSLHLRRSELRRHKWEERGGLDWARSCAMCGAHQEIERAEQRNLLDEALARLTEEQRLILALREVEELDYEAIAEQLRVPVGTVRSRLNRARAALREQLASYR